ncbi:PAS domain S-box protein [Candidatus Binatus sp.]|uniref:PAS domain-containing hybrid sensor histidine kinase/response regulator n=1 Tax=Candidatus Binatus sp. TaxID=2811406 RepID=UPI003C78193E
MDLQIDPSADGVRRSSPLDSTNGDAASGAAPIIDAIAPEPAGSPREPDDATMRPAALEVPDARAILRVGALAIVAFEIGYTLLDRVEYPQTLARTLPLHVAIVAFGVAALVLTLSPRAMRNWQALTLLILASIMAATASIALINSDSDVLVASLAMSFFAAGTLLPWNARWQAALEAIGALALLAYSARTADPNPRLGIAWMVLVSAGLWSQLSAVLGARYRRKLADQLAELARNDRLLRREIYLRAETATARERDHAQLQASEAMLRKMFEASPDNIAVNSLADGRFVAVNDDYQVAGYTRADVIGNSIIALGMWPDDQQMDRFLENIRRTGRVKNMEITQRRKDGGANETHLISASMVEVNGEACVISMVRDITAIKRVETSLRASHAALRKIFDATLDIIVVTRLSDGAYIDFNQQFERLGYGQKDLDDSLKGRRQIWASEELHQVFRARIMADGVVRNMEVDFILPDGRLMPALVAAVRVELEGEDCVVTMIRDLTAAKQASRALAENEAAQRAIFDLSPDAISVADALDGRYVAVNAEFLRLGSHILEETIGKSDLELGVWAKPSDRERFSATLVSQGQVRNLEVDFLRHDRTIVPTLISAALIDYRHQPCVVAYIRDITPRKQIERDLLSAREELSRQVKALSDSEETFRKLFDANLDSMTLTGTDGNYIDVNQEFTKATGFSRAEAIGHHFADLNMWIHPDEMIAFGDQLSKTNEVRNLEVMFRMKGGAEQPVLLSALNLELHGQLCCLTISREISDLKMTQRELVAAREAALAASRAKSEFLSSMSHEIRTPMNSILGMADQLMETALDDEQRRYLSTVISNGHALLALINGILDLAKVESGRISLEAIEFDLKDAIEKALETLAIRAHEKGLELMVRFAPEIPDLVLGDSLRLGQILINLVGNAIKFTHKGQVMVTVEHDPGSTAAGALKFTVRDTGIGIAADQRHLLFHPFSQADSSTSRKYGGSGLGLAIVARLVALMHGTVEVSSEAGSGSAFSFTARFGTAPAIAASGPLFGGMRIIVAGDNAASRSILSDLLTAQAAQVVAAASAAEATARLRRDNSPGSADPIVLLDSALPRRGGFESARQLVREGLDRRRLVMMLGTNDLTCEVAGLRAMGIDNYLVKPVRRAELFAAVARARAGSQLKARDDRAAPPPIAAKPALPAVLDRPLKILMADDSRDNRALIRAYLKKTPYRLEEAEDGQQAIDKFTAGNFDLVLMDIQMPIVDGYEATSTIRVWELANGRRRTPIVALTASALEEAAHRTQAAGCDAHVTKPVTRSTLLEAIRDAVSEPQLDDGTADHASLKEAACRTE